MELKPDTTLSSGISQSRIRANGRYCLNLNKEALKLRKLDCTKPFHIM
jgi:hypothetical protein